MTPSTDTSTRTRQERYVPVPDKPAQISAEGAVDDQLKIWAAMMKDARKMKAAANTYTPPRPPLTDQQLHTLSVIGGEMDSREIAAALDVSASRASNMMASLRARGFYTSVQRGGVNVWTRTDKEVPQ